MKHDPRKDPRPGDVLTRPVGRYEVTKIANRTVWYNLTNPNVRHIMYNIPMECKETLPGWRRRMEEAEVIHVSED